MFLRRWIFWTSRWIRAKWRLDSEYFHLSLTPRSSSVGPLLTNILRIYYEMLITLANAFTNVANAYARFTNVTNAYEKWRWMTVFATFAEICKLSDLRKEVGKNLWTFRICYQRLRRHGECCEVWAIVKSPTYSPCESSIEWPIFVIGGGNDLWT